MCSSRRVSGRPADNDWRRPVDESEKCTICRRKGTSTAMTDLRDTPGQPLDGQGLPCANPRTRASGQASGFDYCMWAAAWKTCCREAVWLAAGPNYQTDGQLLTHHLSRSSSRVEESDPLLSTYVVSTDVRER